VQGKIIKFLNLIIKSHWEILLFDRRPSSKMLPKIHRCVIVYKNRAATVESRSIKDKECQVTGQCWVCNLPIAQVYIIATQQVGTQR
jgi:hypothetical protein